MSGHVVIGKNGIRKPDFILKGFDNTNTFRILADLLMNRENGKVKGGKVENLWQKLYGILDRIYEDTWVENVGQ